MELMTKVKELELENKDLKSKLQANIDYNEKNALVLGEKVISIHVLVQRDRQLAAHAGGLEGRACSGKEGQAGACAVSAWLSECRKVLALSNDNRELISNLMSVKNEVAEKMNQANEIYNKALGVMEANSKQAVGGTKSSEKLDEYMLSSLSAPLASTVNVVIEIVDSREAEIQDFCAQSGGFGSQIRQFRQLSGYLRRCQPGESVGPSNRQRNLQIQRFHKASDVSRLQPRRQPYLRWVGGQDDSRAGLEDAAVKALLHGTQRYHQQSQHTAAVRQNRLRQQRPYNQTVGLRKDASIFDGMSLVILDELPFSHFFGRRGTGR
eukprot:TRINITY_DN1155_c0_g1_i5.p1 TRINITY_DN1155_c0_g1~~TRINITY_DN1155_c0_g1_i5.p1  ORF type:complete len:323 (+),score=7.56 TRINITY_DN1155_c0_g1_i5:504-1472(+)